MKNIFCIGLLLLLANCSAKTPYQQISSQSLRVEDIALENRLERCLDVRPLRISRYENLLLLSAEFWAKQSTGECGCLSAELSYSLTESIPINKGEEGSSTQKRERVFGKFLGPRGQQSFTRHFEFVLMTDAELQTYPQYTLSISCARPD
jgi:hypothetical protein